MMRAAVTASWPSALVVLLTLAAGCAGDDPPTGAAEARLEPIDGFAEAPGGAAAGLPAVTGHDLGHDHAHVVDVTGTDAHDAAVTLDHAHSAGLTGEHHHAPAASAAVGASGDAALGAEALAEAQRQVMSGIGAATPTPEPPAPQTAPAEPPLAVGGEVRTHDDGVTNSHGAGAPATWTVRYTADGAFVPERLDITTGDVVVFVNESATPTWPASNIHPTHEILPEFDPLRAVAPGESWSFTFRRNGYWRYHNHIDAAEAGLIVATGGPAEDLQPLNLAALDVTFAAAPPDAGGEELLDDADALERFVLAYGPAAAVAELKAVELATGRDCHAASHEVGHVAYENFGAAAYTLAVHDCHSGILHGIIESLISDRGTSRLAADVASLCSSAANDFLVHQCYHGVGHGLLAWTTYELPEALLLCDRMPAHVNRDACYGGVHMENGVGGLSGLMGHTTEYLDADRPHFPCDILPEHHVPGCYFWQTSNLFWFGYPAPEVAELCFEAPVHAHESCWWSMGRDLGSIHRDGAAAAAELCGLADTVAHLTDCFQGAALSRFTEAANAAFSAELCAIAEADHPPEVAEGCWQMVLRDAPHILIDPTERSAFCEGVESPPRRRDCAAALGV